MRPAYSICNVKQCGIGLLSCAFRDTCEFHLCHYSLAVFLVEIGKVHQEDLVCFEALNTLLLALLQYESTKKRRFPRKSYRRTRLTQFREEHKPMCSTGISTNYYKHLHEETSQLSTLRRKMVLFAWWNLSEVPQEQQDKWWSDFVQKYYSDSDHHNLVKTLWTKKLRKMISNNINKGKTHNKKPKFVVHVSTTNSKNRKSERDGDSIHQHISGSKSYAKVKYEMMMELGEKTAITDLCDTFVDKRAQRIIEEVEYIFVSEHPNTDETDSQGSNSEASITPLMRDKVVKPHKGRLFGLGTSQMENYDHIAPPAVVLTRQAQLEEELINLTRMVKLMSQQLTALCEARGVTASDATINPSPSSPPTPNEQRIYFHISF
ncbi:hypothetical protein HID58_014226 [Brassica napus]|uniref:Uncharacterized protein n=1 Tax=Brassica napus TaxID=3708 RepID=A0ABQ8DGJ4_BRANA|nr:hypothetical protein HID58_014226 [Brassica napus]